MQVVITLSNRAVVESQIKAKLEQLKMKVGEAVQGAGIDCEAMAKQNCPVDTGRLRSSIKYTKITDLSCSVGTNVNYGPYIEFGHRTRSGTTVAPRPFLFPAYLNAKQSLLKELKAITV